MPELPELRPLGPEDETVAVGLSDDDRTVESEGRTIHLANAFPFGNATEMRARLEDAGIAAIVLPIEGATFPGGQGAYEVHVRPEDQAEAEAFLRAQWAALSDFAGPTVAGMDAETCPACGAHVPLDQDECPDCGLVVGAGE